MKPEEPNKRMNKVEMPFRFKWKRLFAKKWVFPALYMAAAALIFSMVWWYQTSRDFSVTKPDTKLQETVLNTAEEETEQLIVPVAKESKAEMKMGFYDDAGSEKSKEASLVKYANTYWPHSGVDFARKDGKTFDVVAALSGKVIRVEENPVIGHVVEIAHGNGLITVYQSLANVKVAKDDQVRQGDVIAEAGRNNFEKEAGIHLHFEVRKDQQAVNPDQYLKIN